MNRTKQLERIAAISAMHRQRAARHLEAASSVERQRKAIAEDGREAERRAAEQAKTFVAARFEQLKPDTCNSAFFSSLALGHREARIEAAACATRADRLQHRHQDAVKTRAKRARALFQAEQKMNQRLKLADAAKVERMQDADAAEEDDAQDIHAARISK